MQRAVDNQNPAPNLKPIEQNWSTIEKSLPGIGRIKLVPGNEEFSKHFDVELFREYAQTGMGSSSLRRSISEHPARLVNLWLSSYSTPDSNLSLSFLRSGTVSRFGEPDLERRLAASEIAAKELLSAAAVLGSRSKNNQDLEHNLTLTAIDLQSPIEKTEGWPTELATPQEHRAALLQVSGSKFLVGERVVTVGVRAFNIPTSERIYLNKDQWPLNGEMIEALKTLFPKWYEMAPKYLQPALSETAEEGLYLLEKERAGAASLAERYGLAARVVALSTIAGEVAHFNCLAGKDRTGFLDVEVKFLAYQISQRLGSAPVSPPGGKVLPSEEEAWHGFLLNGGNHEIQLLNIGARGSTLSHGYLKERVGIRAWDEFIGDAQG